MKSTAFRIVGVLGLIVVACSLLPVGGHPMSAKTIQAQNDEYLILQAIKCYQAAYGWDALPANNRAAIVQALLGDNQGEVDYLDLARSPDLRRLTKQLLDPWGHPYLIDLSDPERPKIHSAGKNGKDEGELPGSDDVYSWR